MGQTLLGLAQQLLKLIALNRERHRARCESDQFAVGLRRAARLAVIHGESSENASGRCHNGRRPAGAQPMFQSYITVVRAKRIIGDIGNENWLTSEGGCATGSSGGANFGAVDRVAIGLGQTWCRAA